MQGAINRPGKGLPAIPEKKYFSIGETAHLCAVKPHVLRYWEQEFKQITPNKRQGNRRYYQRKDVLLIRRIKQLLYDEGYTIEGARQLLSGNKTKIINTEQNKMLLQEVIADLEELLNKMGVLNHT